jgi:hypothetical protein
MTPSITITVSTVTYTAVDKSAAGTVPQLKFQDDFPVCANAEEGGLNPMSWV